MCAAPVRRWNGLENNIMMVIFNLEPRFCSSFNRPQCGRSTKAHYIVSKSGKQKSGSRIVTAINQSIVSRNELKKKPFSVRPRHTIIRGTPKSVNCIMATLAYHTRMRKSISIVVNYSASSMTHTTHTTHLLNAIQWFLSLMSCIHICRLSFHTHPNQLLSAANPRIVYLSESF